MYTKTKEQIKIDLNKKYEWGKRWGQYPIIKAQLKSFVESTAAKPNEFELMALVACGYFRLKTKTQKK